MRCNSFIMRSIELKNTTMKKLCLLLLLITPMFGFGQNNGTWSVSTHFQSDHSFIPAMHDDIYYPMIEPMTYDRFHYSTGFGVNYRFANQLELSTGLRYSKKREEMTGYPYYGFCGTVDWMLISYMPSTRQYIEAPLLARYYFLPGNLKLHVESGWIGSYRVDRFSYSKEHEWMLSAQTGVGVNLFLNRWQFALGANYRLQFDLAANRSYFSAMNPHAFGFEFKTAFSLNN